MLYSGSLVIADTFKWNRPNHGQTLVEKPLYSRHAYSGHNFLAPREKFKPKFPLYSDTPYFLWKSKNKLFSNFQMFLFDALLYFSTPLLTLLYLVSHQELHEFPELRLSQKYLAGTRSQNSKTRKLPRNLYTADTWLSRTVSPADSFERN